ncbi:MAG: DUF922 domain-containing protein [Lysobacteraceae bacterium]
MRRFRLRCGLLALLVIAPCALPAMAEVVLSEELRHYTLDAVTAAELAEQLIERRRLTDGARAHGLTEAHIETRYQLHPDASGQCRPDTLRVQVHIVQTLPQWVPQQTPPEALRAQMQRMLAALAVHEDGHRRHVLDAASAIERKLAALPAAINCERARRAAEGVVSRELTRLQARETNYDLATDHGRTQGAVLWVEEAAPRPRGRPSRRTDANRPLR